MNDIKDFTIVNIREKFRYFINKTSKGLYVKEKKFLKDMLKSQVLFCV